MKKLIHLAALLLCTLPALAEQKIERGNYIVHYNAFNSTMVAPEVAQQHQLARSRFTAMLNVAVFEKLSDGTVKAVTADLSAQAKNLLQQHQDIQFTPIKEGDALYYIGTFTFANEEVKHLSIQVQPQAKIPAIKINFDQKFYTDTP